MRVRHTLLTLGLASVLVLSASDSHAQSGWAVEGSHSGSMTLVATLDAGASDFADRLAAFAGGDMRGVATPQVLGGTVFYFLTIAGSTPGEPIALRFFDAKASSALPVCTALAFRDGATRGTIRSPLPLRLGRGEGDANCAAHWSPVPGYASTFTVHAYLTEGGARADDETLRLAAFAGSEVRAAATPFSTPEGPAYRLEVTGDVNGESITFLAYDPSASETHEVTGSVAFVAGGAAGTAGTPLALTLGEVRSPSAAPFEVLGAGAFGASVAVDGTRALIGAPEAASAQVFESDGAGAWSHAAALTPSGDADDFGASVSLDGDIAMIGAPGSGAAYVFERGSGAAWAEAAVLTPSGSGSVSGFGTSVSVSGDRVLVGVLGDASAYIFESDGVGAWSQVVRLTPGSSADGFGSSVSLHGDVAVVGAPGGGVAYVFERGGGGAWAEVAVLTPSGSAASFGAGVSASGARIAVGVPDAEAVYVFERDSGGAWAEVAMLTPSASAAGFGTSVAMEGDRVLVGAPMDAGSAGVSGAVYRLERRADVWQVEERVVAPPAGSGGAFGGAVALGGEAAFVGALAGGEAFGSAYALDLPRSVAAVSVEAAVTRSGWRLLSPPIADASIATLRSLSLVQGIPGEFPSASPNIYTEYDGARGFSPPSSDTEALVPGRGFIWYLYDTVRDPDDTDVRGDSESAGLPLTLTTEGLAPANSVTLAGAFPDTSVFYMLGNPFGTAFDIDGLSLREGSGALNVSVAVWDPGEGETGSYRIVTRTGDPTSGDDLISVWQGFFAVITGADTPAPPTFEFDIAAARGTAPFRGKTSGTASTTPSGRLDLRLDGTLDSDGTRVVDVATSVLASDAATLGWDAFDFPKLTSLGYPAVSVSILGAGPNGASISKALESIPSALPGLFVLRLRLEATHAGTFALSWPSDTLPAEWSVHLHDAVTGQRYDVRTDTAATFTTAEAATTERFTLHLAPTATSTQDAPEGPTFALSAAWPNPARGAARVSISVSEAQPVSVVLYDALGRRVGVLHEGTVLHGAPQRIELPATLAAGIYAIHASSGRHTATRRLVKL